MTITLDLAAYKQQKCTAYSRGGWIQDQGASMVAFW